MVKVVHNLFIVLSNILKKDMSYALLHDSKTRYNSSLSVTITIEFSLFSLLFYSQNVSK